MPELPGLQYVRERAGLSPSELALRASLSEGVILRAERGWGVFPDTVAELAAALGVTAEDLLSPAP
jgi:hypothetical protein